MNSRFWSFVEACDATRSPRAAQDLHAATMRALDFDTYAIVTHAPRNDLRSLGVMIHNWPTEAIDQLLERRAKGAPSFILDAVERTTGPVYWDSQQRREPQSKVERQWFNRLRDLLGGGEGVSCALKSTIVTASCSVTSSQALDLERVRLCMRLANYTYQQILHLQRPQLAEPERLTAREHELLYRATVLGERPSDVAHQLGVKISTVRTLRQKAGLRLDAGSQEQAAWRMLETGQLFRCGRKSRPRSR